MRAISVIRRICDEAERSGRKQKKAGPRHTRKTFSKIPDNELRMAKLPDRRQTKLFRSSVTLIFPPTLAS